MPKENRDHVVRRLDAELEKDVSDMDVNAVKALISELDVDGISAEKSASIKASLFPKTSVRQRQRRRGLPRRLVAAVCAAAAIFALQVVSVASGNNLLYDFYNWTKAFLFSMDKAPVIQDGDFAVTTSDAQKFNSLEDAAQTLDVDILIPSWLPGDGGIVEVVYQDYGAVQKVNAWFAGDFNVSIEYDFTADWPQTVPAGEKQTVCNREVFWLAPEANDGVGCLSFDDEGFRYTAFGLESPEECERFVEGLKYFS
jgi:hypothetical protein